MAGKLNKLLYIVALFALVNIAHAIEPFKIQDIRLQGANRIASGTIFNYLPLKIGDVFDDARSGESVRALYKTGFFKDVRLEREGDVLVVFVQERPAIAKIEISGNSDIPTEALVDGLKQTGLEEGQVFNRSLLDRMQQELSRQYFALGKYAVSVDTSVVELDENRVEINVEISEGKTALIKQINVVGNNAFTDKEILKKFKQNTPTMFSFFTKSDQYSKQKMGADLESLRSLYLDNGYINFNIDSTQVSITPDKNDVYITINITEGDQFLVSSVKLAGDLIVDQEELFKLVTIQKGMVFSRKEVTKSSSKISDRIGDEGYAFANVNSVPNINKENKTVEITYFVEPGKRAYVRRVNFTGNTKTRDEVLRREMRQLEGAWISTSKVERSKVRLQRLGYFKDVNVETPAVPGTSDQVDVNFTVEENPSGNLMLGLGFSQSQGIIFNSSVTQDNFLGSGKSISFAFNNSEVNRRFVLGYTNPYWTIDGVSRGFRVAYTKTDAGDANLARYESTNTVLGMNFGIPVSEHNYLRTYFDYESTEMDIGVFSSNELADFVSENDNDYVVLRSTTSFTYDTRNKAILPTKGTQHRISAEVALPGGDLRYYKLDYRAQWFYPLSDRYTLLLKGNVGYGDSYGDTGRLPFFENFYAGGPRTVRGYEENTLGPKDTFGRSLGGDLKFVANAEVILPIPYFEQLDSVRLTGFFDMGNVWGWSINSATNLWVDNEFDMGDLRMAAGISGLWLSPFGALTASFAQPFNDQTGDKTQSFQFTFGTSF